MRYMKFLLLGVLGLSGCKDNGVKVLKKDFFNTNIGTTKNQKFIKEPPKKIAKSTIKKINIKTHLDRNIPKNVKKRKERFIKILVPILQLVHTELAQQYLQISKDMKTNTNREYINLLKQEYKAKTDKQLLQALKPHPISIVLAQAAIESAWLTSRFALEANNIFGIWSLKSSEPRIAASSLRKSKTIYLRKYKTLKVSIEDYYKNIGKNRAYKKFRKARLNTNDPYKLIKYLRNYSERKEHYVKLLKKMIQYNNFTQYDKDLDENYNIYR